MPNTADNFRAHLRDAAMRVSWQPSWQQTMLGGTAHPNHISPNGAEYGSNVHAAEAWMLAHGLPIMREKYSHLYQAMLDQFSDSIDSQLFQTDIDAYYRAIYARRDKLSK